jgi:hypothetical protein
MMRHGPVRIAKFALIAVVAVAVFGAVVSGLWNWLVPALFGGPSIGFWQALGLLLLSRILFGGFRGGHGHHPAWRRRMLERWEQMTPEEREKLRAGLRARCHGEAEPGTPPTESHA